MNLFSWLRSTQKSAGKPTIRIEKPDIFPDPLKPFPSSSPKFIFLKILIAFSYLFSLFSLAFALRSYFSPDVK